MGLTSQNADDLTPG